MISRELLLKLNEKTLNKETSVRDGRGRERTQLCCH